MSVHGVKFWWEAAVGVAAAPATWPGPAFQASGAFVSAMFAAVLVTASWIVGGVAGACSLATIVASLTSAQAGMAANLVATLAFSLDAAAVVVFLVHGIFKLSAVVNDSIRMWKQSSKFSCSSWHVSTLRVSYVKRYCTHEAK